MHEAKFAIWHPSTSKRLTGQRQHVRRLPTGETYLYLAYLYLGQPVLILPVLSLPVLEHLLVLPLPLVLEVRGELVPEGEEGSRGDLLLP